MIVCKRKWCKEKLHMPYWILCWKGWIKLKYTQQSFFVMEHLTTLVTAQLLSYSIGWKKRKNRQHCSKMGTVNKLFVKAIYCQRKKKQQTVYGQQTLKWMTISSRMALSFRLLMGSKFPRNFEDCPFSLFLKILSRPLRNYTWQKEGIWKGQEHAREHLLSPKAAKDFIEQNIYTFFPLLTHPVQ